MQYRGTCRGGRGVHLGLGTAVRQSLVIAPWVTVGMQSAVVKDLLEAGVVAMGAPAVKTRPVDFPSIFIETWPPGWLEELRRHGKD